MSALERVQALVDPIVDAEGLELYDLELNGGVLRVLVDQPGGAGMDAITRLTRALSRALDEADPIAGTFTLEVSSPGLERPLRTPAHFEGAVGSLIAVKTKPGTPGGRRLRGTVESVDPDGIAMAISPDDGSDPAPDADDAQVEDDPVRHVAFADIERARTVFEWGPAPKPGGPKKPRSKASAAREANPGGTKSGQKNQKKKTDPRKKVIAS